MEKPKVSNLVRERRGRGEGEGDGGEIERKGTEENGVWFLRRKWITIERLNVRLYNIYILVCVSMYVYASAWTCMHVCERTHVCNLSISISHKKKAETNVFFFFFSFFFIPTLKILRETHQTLCKSRTSDEFSIYSHRDREKSPLDYGGRECNILCNEDSR